MSEQYLLFDGGCSVCAALAREVETLSGGRLGVRNLRDPEIQVLLNRARPGWRWEPMLVEIDGEQVRVFAGLAMRMRLLQILGPARALRVARAVARHGGPVLGVDWGRRRLLQQMTGALGVWIVWRGFSRFASPPIERYAPAGTVEVLTGILVERQADRLILAHADKLWQIIVDTSTTLWKGGERELDALQIGDEIMARGWGEAGTSTLRALRLWANLTRVHGIVVETSNSYWRVRGGQRHGEEEEYEITWRSLPQRMDFHGGDPSPEAVLDIREGDFVDIIGESLGPHVVNATRVARIPPGMKEPLSSYPQEAVRIIRTQGSCTYVYQGHARWFNCSAGAGRCRTCDPANSAQAAWPAMDRCGSCAWNCCDCSRGCRNQVYLACGYSVMVKDLCTGTARQITIVDCGPNQVQYCTAGCGWPDCLRYSTPIIDLTRPTFAWFGYDPAQRGCFSCEVRVTLPC